MCPAESTERMGDERRKIVLFRGSDRNEVLAFNLAPQVEEELRRRGFSVRVVDIPLEITRHGKLMAGLQPDRVIERGVADFKNEVMAREGDNAMGFDLHNYSVEDLPEDSSGRPEDFRIGDKGYLSVFPDATLRSLPEIFSELAWERVYVVEIPAVYKEMSERVRRRLLHTLHLYGERPLSYETTVVDMRKSHEIGLDQLCVVRKIADLIEQSETWERQMEEAM